MNAGRMAGLSCLVLLAACGGGDSEGGRVDRNETAAVVDTGPVANDSPEGSDVADAGVGRPTPSPFEVPGATSNPDRGTDVPTADTGGENAGVGALRIVLTWDRRPNDLDAHLTGPERGGEGYFHVFSGDRGAEGARLVEDATMGTGPEVVEIDRREVGVYRYSVFNFSSDADRPLQQSGARVEVFSDGAYMTEFTVPAGVGNLWTVFDIDGGEIVAVNAITRLRNILDYFPPPGREQASGAVVARGVNEYR